MHREDAYKAGYQAGYQACKGYKGLLESEENMLIVSIVSCLFGFCLALFL